MIKFNKKYIKIILIFLFIIILISSFFTKHIFTNFIDETITNINDESQQLNYSEDINENDINLNNTNHKDLIYCNRDSNIIKDKTYPVFCSGIYKLNKHEIKNNISEDIYNKYFTDTLLIIPTKYDIESYLYSPSYHSEGVVENEKGIIEDQNFKITTESFKYRAIFLRDKKEISYNKDNTTLNQEKSQELINNGFEFGITYKNTEMVSTTTLNNNKNKTSIHYDCNESDTKQDYNNICKYIMNNSTTKKLTQTYTTNNQNNIIKNIITNIKSFEEYPYTNILFLNKDTVLNNNISKDTIILKKTDIFAITKMSNDFYYGENIKIIDSKINKIKGKINRPDYEYKSNQNYKVYEVVDTQSGNKAKIYYEDSNKTININTTSYPIKAIEIYDQNSEKPKQIIYNSNYLGGNDYLGFLTNENTSDSSKDKRFSGFAFEDFNFDNINDIVTDNNISINSRTGYNFYFIYNKKLDKYIYNDIISNIEFPGFSYEDKEMDSSNYSANTHYRDVYKWIDDNFVLKQSATSEISPNNEVSLSTITKYDIIDGENKITSVEKETLEQDTIVTITTKYGKINGKYQVISVEKK